MFGALDNWIWLAIGVVLVGLEMLAPGVFLFWLGLAAFAVAFAQLILLAIGVSLSFAAHLVLFAIFSLITVAIGRRLSAWSASDEKPNLNRRGQSMIGRVFPLQTDIVDGCGTIRIDDTVWRVKGADLPMGHAVRVERADGAELYVVPA